MANVTDIVGESEEILATARYGLSDAHGADHPGRRRAGFRNAVVFGRMVTLALQNIRGKHDHFEQWYTLKQDALRADPIFKRIYEMRTEIEKQAKMPIKEGITVNLSEADGKRLTSNPPPGAKAFFIADQNHLSGWEVETSAGKVEKYYVDLPEGAVQTIHKFVNLDGGLNLEKDAVVELTRYLDFLGDMVDEAKKLFV